MPLNKNSTARLFLQVSGKVLLVVAGLAFFFGGRAFHEFFGTYRATAEVEGIAIAIVSGAIGMVLSGLAENFADYKEQ